MNKNKLGKQVMYMIFLLLSLSLATAANMTIQELIDSYDYDFNNGTINITSQDDYMVDRDSDGTNDTLIVNLTTDRTSGTYTFIIGIVDDNGILINDTSKTLTASESSANVNFPSELLSQTKFNYSIRINDNGDNLVFRKFNVESQTYSTYETGTNVTLITDNNINNNFIRINLTIDSSQAITTNVTVTLAYNSSTISETAEKTLSSGVQNVSIDFDNETIKSTHYNSNFTIDTVVVGNKIFDFDQNTSIYNYEDFAKTSYIKAIADGRIDTDNNNLSEFLEINFTVEIKEANNYTISYDLYDEFDNFVINISENETLSVGTQNMQTLVNGSEIYKTKINGPYVLSFAKLHIGNDTKDIIFDAHTTNQSFYTDYERPPLPDLNVSMNVIFNETTSITNITIGLSNIGEAPAFNVFLDIFDNTTYENNRSLAFMDVGESITYKFNLTNSSNATLYTTIADFDNLVDETNESNNIVQNTPPQVVSLTIESITTLHSNATLKTFEFIILNNGDTTVTDIYWNFDTGDNYIVNSTTNMSSLAANEKAFVYLQYNHSSGGSFNVNASATGLSQSDTVTGYLTSSISIGDLVVTSFDDLNIDGWNVIFEAVVDNNLESSNITNINWSLTTDDNEIINATQLFNLASSESMFIYIQYPYSSGGTYNPSFAVTNPAYTDSESTTISIPSIDVSNLTVMNESGTKRIFEVTINNALSNNLTNVSWTFDTKNNTIINSTSNVTLQPNEEIYVYIDYNFTGAGTFNVNATAKNGSLSNSRNLSVTIT